MTAPSPDTDDDIERTVVRAADAATIGNALAPGTRLHEFEITKVIGEGGFGIVYLAHDHALQRPVAIKEYMPATLARRTRTLAVSVRSQRHADTFALGLKSFVNEARLLAQFDHPSLMKVHRFWEANGTAYMAMPYVEGRTLRDVLAAMNAPPDEAYVVRLLDSLLDALAALHARHCVHRDIAPDNILMLADGRPLLLDFGAARQVIGDLTSTLTVILKSGYAPVEQYGELPELKQGPWTDLYALGAVAQFAITGRTPPQGLARYIDDKRKPLARTHAGRYGERLLRAIDAALAVHPRDRPQSAQAMRAMLGAGDDDKVGVASPGVRRAVVVGVLSLAGAAVLYAGAELLRRPAPPINAPASASAEPGAFSRLREKAGDEGVVVRAQPRADPHPDPLAQAGEGAKPVAAPPERSSPSLPAVAYSPTPSVQPTPRIDRTGDVPERCRDIIQRASLGEPLEPDDTQYLKQECRP